MLLGKHARRQAPPGDRCRWHRRLMMFPHCRWHSAYLDIRDMDARETDATIAHTAFQIVHHEGGLGHTADVQLCLRACDHQSNVEPDVSRNVDGRCETGAVVDLPGSRALEQRRILLRVVQPGFMRPQIHRFSIPVGLCTKEYVVKPTSSASGHIEVNHPVCHFEVLQSGDVVLECEAAPTQVVRDFRLEPELPSWRIGRKGFHPRYAEADGACDSNGQGERQYSRSCSNVPLCCVDHLVVPLRSTASTLGPTSYSTAPRSRSRVTVLLSPAPPSSSAWSNCVTAWKIAVCPPMPASPSSEGPSQ